MDKVKSWIFSNIYSSTLAEKVDEIRLGLDVIKSALRPNTVVDGDPPLCQNCSRVFSQAQKIGQTNYLSPDIAKLKLSATLGCYLCSLLYRIVWIPRSATKGRILEPKTLKDIDHLPDVIGYWIDESTEEERQGCFEIHFVATFLNNSSGDMWEVMLLLIPERDIDDAIPQPIPRATSAETASSLGLNWIQNCKDYHKECSNRSRSNTWIPSRLVYVGPSNEPLKPRLYISKAAPMEANFRYTTLSHCWGSLTIFRLLSSNIDELTNSIPLDSLTKVFCDAMDLTRRLGTEYIWIDSLCIIQDSYDDWAKESAMMGNVYSHTWCNIAATGFPDGSASVYVQRDPLLPQLRKFSLDMRDGAVSVTRQCLGKYYCMEDFWQSDIINAPLGKRAWAFQERVLSPRVLHLGSRQIFWECKELEACEQFPDGIPNPLKREFKATHSVKSKYLKYDKDAREIDHNEGDEYEHSDQCDDSNETGDVEMGDIAGCNNAQDDKEVNEETEAYLLLLDKWNKMIFSYNDKILTKYEDKLICISGIAKQMQEAIGCEFVAGLWAKEITLQLIWTVQMESYQVGRMVQPPIYQAPSWSWASINTPVDDLFNTETHKEALKHLLASVTEFNVTRKDGNEFGQITDGFLRIFGPLLTKAAFVDSDKTLRANPAVINPPIKLFSRLKKRDVVVSPTILVDTHVMIPNENGLPSFPIRDSIGTRDFWLLPICFSRRYLGLILQPTGVKGQYKRVGAWAQSRQAEEETEKFKNHEALLEDEDYQELDQNGNPTIMII